MISAYGSRAQRYAASLGDLDAIVIEPATIGEGYVEAVRRRYAGEPFYGMLLLQDSRDATLTAIAPALMLEAGGPDHHRALMNAVTGGKVVVNGKPAAELLAATELSDANVRAGAREFLLLCPALLVRSQAEYERLCEVLVRRRSYEVVVVEPALPAAERRPAARPGFVIWAPERTAETAAHVAFALSELHGDVTLVSVDGVVPRGSNVTAYAAGDPRVAVALASASVVVVPDATDPGAAVAFARAGYGVAAPVSSGAHEFVRDVCSYDPAVQREVHVAATLALARPATLRYQPARPPRAPLRPAVPAAVVASPPPATIVIPTYNRRADIARALQCLAGQTYPNVRAVVVNDAGENIDDIVAAFPFARVRNLERNAGMVEAFIAGCELVTEGYVQVFSDDDWLYPDHVELLVTAMERTGASAAHANMLIRYLQRAEDGSYVTTGYNLGLFTDTATPTEALIGTSIGGHAIMWRRAAFTEMGGWRPDCFLADQEIQLRGAQRYAFAYVDQVTAEWRIHGENFSGKVDAGAEQRRIYDVMHPATGRPLVEAARLRILERIAARPRGYVFPPTLRLNVNA